MAGRRRNANAVNNARQRRRAHTALSSAVTALVLAAGVSAALAHARVVCSVPAKHAQLQAPPARVELWFNELLDDHFNAVEVFPAAELKSKTRTQLTRGQPTVDPNDRTHVTVELQPLAPGEYVVEYRVLSRDSHTAPGRFTFRVVASP